MKRNVLHTLALVGLGVVCLLLLGISSVYQRDTLTEWWMPASACGIAAIPAALLLWRGMRALTGYSNRWLNVAAGFAVAFSALLSGFYFLNYHYSDTVTRKEWKAHIERKFSREKTRTERLGRRSTKQVKYTAYYVELGMPGGGHKEYEVPLRRYLKLKKGHTVRMDVEKGLFGLYVLKNYQI